MKRIIVTLVLLLSFASIVQSAPALNRQFTFTASGRGASINVIGLGIGYYRITWATSGGTTSACTTDLEASTDNATWSAIPVANQTCTSDGAATVTASGTANSYVSVNTSTFTSSGGTPTLTVNVLAYVDIATGTNGSGAANTVAYFSNPTTLVGSSNLTFDGTHLKVADGTAGAPSYSFITATGNGLYNLSASSFGIALGGAVYHEFVSTGFYTSSNQEIAWTSAVNLGGSADVRLVRDAANVLALKNGTTAQEFRVYGTTTGPKYLTLTHDGTDSYFGSFSGQAVLKTATDSLIAFQINSASKWAIGSSATNYAFFPVSNDNSFDLGLVGTRIRSIYLGNALNVGLLTNALGNIYEGSDTSVNHIMDSIATSGYSIITGRTANGTQASRTNSASGDIMFSMLGRSFSGATGYWDTSEIRFVVDAAVTNNQRPASRIDLYTNAVNGAQVKQMDILSGGGVHMFNLTNANAQDYVCYNTTTKELEQNVTTCNLSSEVYKHDIQPLNAGLKEVLAMQPVSFVYNVHPELGPLIGFTAQKTEPIDKRLVSYFKDGTLRSVDYMGYTAVLTKAIQELNQKVEALSAKVN